jgi:hypothetical protein
VAALFATRLDGAADRVTHRLAGRMERSLAAESERLDKGIAGEYSRGLNEPPFR